MNTPLRYLLLICMLMNGFYAAAQTQVNSRSGKKTQEKTSQPLEVLDLEFYQVTYMAAVKEIADVFQVGLTINADLMPQGKVSKTLKTVTLQEALNLLFQNTEVAGYVSNNETIMLKERSDPQEIVRGNVTDEEGNPLPGVNVLVKGTSQGTVTDIDGNFSIDEQNEQNVLVFSFVGYVSKEIQIGQQNTINVQLATDAKSLNEVVVVGYGTQKKVNLTGSVEHVSSEVIEERPITNLAQGLQGVVPNLNITFPSGQPGQGAQYNIRGITSINGGEPLILIDGIPGDPNLINPKDIASVSVLKDAASAAIYGARAAYGVILITTKSPEKGKIQVQYSANFATKTPTVLPQAVTDTYTSMSLYNDAYRGYSGQDVLTAEELEYAKQRSENPSLPAVVVEENSSGKEYKYFGNTDWFDEMYQNNSSQMQHNVAISGGDEKLSYYLSGSYFNQQGSFKYNPDVYKRYNFRAKLNAQLNDWLSIYDNVMYNRANYDFPTFWGNSVDIWRYVVILGSAQGVPQNPDGSWTFEGFPIGFLRDGGRGFQKDNLLQNTLGFNMSFLDDHWRINGNYTYQNDGYNQNEHYKPIEYSSTPDVISERGISRVVETNTDNYYHVFNVFTEYENQLNNHYYKGMIGFNQELRTFSRSIASRNNLISDLSSLNLATGDRDVAGSASEWALRGIFYRINYSFDDRYLLEFNGRYDGTSRFPQADRFGFFPSVSAGWRISEEEFFAGISPKIQNFKLRASYGVLGNQQIQSNNAGGDFYPYVPRMNTFSPSVIVNGERLFAIGAPGLVSSKLTWEKATTLDFGLDLTLWNQLEFTYDWYQRKTTDMLTQSKALPAVLGTQEPQENAADLRTRGWEVSLKWNNATDLLGKDFSYNLGLVLSDYRAEITRFDNPNNYLGDYYEGQRFGEIWGYQTEGFFQSEEEIKNHADQTEVFRFPNNIAVGDLKFADRNGDGKISMGDNTLENPGDRYVIGNTTPRFSYGLNGGFNWNNLTFSFFFQGIGQRDYYPGGEEAYFWSVYNRYYNTALEHLVGNYWTPENQDAYFPRLKAYIALVDGKELSAPQTRYLQDASYLRLKNITLGYTLPVSFTSRFGIDRFRVYFSGENLWEHTNLIMPVDPESILTNHSWGDGQTYPFQRTYSLGLDITF